MKIIRTFADIFFKVMHTQHRHNTDTDFHIGRLIKTVVMQKGIKVQWLAQQLGCHRNNVYLIFSRSWIDTGSLMKLSQILEHDFFADLSGWYKEELQ